jgi:hypothetical protein
MSQSPNQTSPSQINKPQPQPSDIITDVVPLSVVHPSFASALKPKTSKPSPTKPSTSPKPKSKKKSKTKTTQKPKSQKPKSRYYSNFNMQELYLDNQGSTSGNVASDVATPTSGTQITPADEDSPKTLNVEQGETGVETEGPENIAPNTPSDEGVNLSTKIVEEALNSLADSIPSENVVPDAPTSLAQAQHVADAVETQEEDSNTVVVDQELNLEKDTNVAEDTDKGVSSEEDLVVLKCV